MTTPQSLQYLKDSIGVCSPPLPRISRRLPLYLRVARAIFGIIPARVKELLYSTARTRLGKEIYTNVFRLPFGLVLKYTRDKRNIEARALRVLDDVEDVNAPLLVDSVTTPNSSCVLTTYIEGDSCSCVWDEFSGSDKERFVADLHDQFAALHDQTTSRTICNAAGSFIRDPRLPWASEHKLNIPSTEEFFRQVWLGLDFPHNRETIRPLIEPVIERDIPIVFCHGDLVERNIIFPGGLDAWRNGRSRICLVDWKYSGWMPQPWDALKATFMEYEPENEWIEIIRNVFPECRTYLDADWLWRSKSRVMLI